MCYYLRRPTSASDREPQHVRVGPGVCACGRGRHVRPIHLAARADFDSHLHPFPLRPIPICMTTLLSACPLWRRVRAFVAQPCSPPREEQQREHPIEAASTRASTARGDETGACGTAWTAPTAQRAARGTFAPSVTRGYTRGSSNAVCNAVLEVVKGAPPWYAVRYSRS